MPRRSGVPFPGAPAGAVPFPGSGESLLRRLVERPRQITNGLPLGGGEWAERVLDAQVFEYVRSTASAGLGEHDLLGTPIGRVRSTLDQTLFFEPVEDERRVRGFAVHPGGQFTRGDRVGQFAERDDLGRGEAELLPAGKQAASVA